MTGTIEYLALAVALFVGSHFGLSSLAVRRSLVAVVGERGFLVLYSALALAIFAWVLIAYREAPYVALWTPSTALRHLSLTIMPLSCILVVAGLTTPSPAAVGTDAAAIAARGPVGIHKITRHPVMWGFGLWGIVHLLANGDAAGTILFAGMTVLALAGAVAIDAKKRATLGDAWTFYARATSYWPLAALAAGRTRVSFAEIGWWRLALGLVLYAILLAAHPWLFGVNPLPF